jgi:hypothetical protein
MNFFLNMNIIIFIYILSIKIKIRHLIQEPICYRNDIEFIMSKNITFIYF